MHKMIPILLILLGSLLHSCKPAKQNSERGNLHMLNWESPEYAKGFQWAYDKEMVFLRLDKAFCGLDDDHYYLLRSAESSSKFKEEVDQIVSIPVQAWALSGTSQLAAMERLGAQEYIVGMKQSMYAFSNWAQEKREVDPKFELGEGLGIDFERIQNSGAEMFVSHGSEGNAQHISKWQELDMKVLYSGEFLEEHPLGMLEWIKVYGLLLNRLEEAEAVFEKSKVAYLKEAQKANLLKNASSSPPKKMLYGLPYKGQWTVPGGKSFQAKLFRDAGASYYWDSTDVLTHFYNLEQIFEIGEDADYWFFPGNAQSLKAMEDIEPRVSWFKAMQIAEVWNNNKRMSPIGGNDYWESGTFLPELILKDLVHILWDKEPDADSLYFFKALK